MALVVAQLVADGQVFGMAVAAFTLGFDVLKRGRLGQHVLTAHPARHHAVQLPGHRFVHFLSGLIQPAHAEIFSTFFNGIIHFLLVLKPKWVPKSPMALRHQHAGKTRAWRHPPMRTRQTAPLEFSSWRIGLKV